MGRCIPLNEAELYTRMPIAPPKASAIFTRFVEPRKHDPGVTAQDQHGQAES